ncbi:MAG: chorismate-binding protein [Spirochaetia bacterium]
MTQVRNDGLIKVISGERFTPFALARKLDAKVILESSSFKKGRERYSLLLVKEAFQLHQLPNRVILYPAGEAGLPVPERDILEAAVRLASEHPAIRQDVPFPAGGVGYLSYEFARRCDAIEFLSKPDEIGVPEAVLLFGHVFVVFDHYTDIIYIIGLNYHGFEIDLEREVERTEARINDLDFNYLAKRDGDYPSRILSAIPESEEFLEGVRFVRSQIERGNLLQGVLSRRLTVETELPAIEAYKSLRSVNPSPYLFYIDFGQFQLFGASPEVHVKVKDGRAVLRPIAGTRRRGADRDEDRVLESDLLGDEKELAEHRMLIDLARNDLGRIARPGTVKVSEMMGIEHYSHVMHIVSQAEAELDEGITIPEVIRATFPAGTVSGAPKIQAIRTIDSIETVTRSFYAGLVGYFEPEGSLDSCITIRSGLKRGNRLYLQAGAGIVYDSIPERELEETAEKLRALASAVGLEV